MVTFAIDRIRLLSCRLKHMKTMIICIAVSCVLPCTIFSINWRHFILNQESLIRPSPMHTLSTNHVRTNHVNNVVLRGFCNTEYL